MSLDFYLKGEEIDEECSCSCCDNIHIRTYKPQLFHANITHNLVMMADKAGVYKCLWRPEESGFDYAEQIIPILEKGLEELRINHDKYIPMNPENGWGSYSGLRSFVNAVLEACKENPKAIIEAST